MTNIFHDIRVYSNPSDTDCRLQLEVNAHDGTWEILERPDDEIMPEHIEQFPIHRTCLSIGQYNELAKRVDPIAKAWSDSEGEERRDKWCELFEAITNYIESIQGDGPVALDCGDWMYNYCVDSKRIVFYVPDVGVVHPSTSDTALSALAQKMRASAGDDDIVLLGAYDWLESLRTQARENADD